VNGCYASEERARARVGSGMTMTSRGSGAPWRFNVPRKSTSRIPAKRPTLAPFARRLKAVRFWRRMTQRVLARRAGISVKYYGEIEHSHVNPTLSMVLRLAEALRVSVALLLEPCDPRATKPSTDGVTNASSGERK
jgi:DNA-binding XRE family transcriptional regulator